MKWYFITLAAIIAVIYSLVLFTGKGGIHERLKPHLGLDLQGGSSMTLSATLPGGATPSKDKLNEARSIIEQRVNATGVSEPEVVTEGNKNIVVNIAGVKSEDEFRKLVSPAELRFRQVLASTADTSAQPSPSASATPSGSATPKSTGSAKPSSGAAAAPKASATPKATTPTPSAATPSPSVTPSYDPNQSGRVAAIQQKVGPAAWAAAQAVSKAPSQLQSNPALAAALKPFSSLSGEEVADLPAEMQFTVPTISCKQLNARPAGSIADPKAKAVGCGSEGGTPTKYYMDVAKVLGTDVSKADYTYDATKGWKVDLSFKGGGQDRWTALTRTAYNNGQNAQSGLDRVAVVLDNQVVSAPHIQGVINGDAEITGSFTKNDVSTLAAQLKYGSLPLSFNIETIDSVTPTLGLQQMQAGLLAGALGLLLVVVYCFLYYRALGFVVVASLVASGTIVFGLVVLLGRQIGFTLTLAGIAGFIVAVGITADSFVVFFERLKDEVRDGRSVRSAVPRAWVRARRTILSADTVSFLAAAVLYLLAIGAVKGFAFTLGLSTIVDLLIVFLFTHPLVAVLSRSRAFSSPRVSGLGSLRKPADAASAPQVRGALRTKES